MNGKTTETVEPNENFDWNQAYTGQGERDLEAADPNFLEMIDRLKPGRALDFGCGAGGLAIELARRGWQVVGIDIAENAITSARKNADRCAVSELLLREVQGVREKIRNRREIVLGQFGRQVPYEQSRSRVRFGVDVESRIGLD